MKIAVLVSGSGTNLQALLDAEASGALAPGEIVAVVSNRAEAPALARAREAGKAQFVVDHKAFATREAFEDELHWLLDKRGVELVVLAGFMRVLTAHFLGRYPQRVINTHP